MTFPVLITSLDLVRRIAGSVPPTGSETRP
jgi:hypothetical protein